jgi:hypothetical protein
LRANSQLNSALRAPPIWKGPVGLGANLTLTSLAIKLIPPKN